MSVNDKMTGNLLTIFVVLILLNGWMYLQQPAMIFFPFGDLQQTPVNLGYKYEDVYLKTGDDLQLHGWYIPHKNSKKTVLFFHGNAGNISHRLDSIKIFHELGLNVFIIDYRGYGKSEGKPSEQGLYSDAQAAWQYLIEKKQLDKNNIILFGRSIGGTVATNLAARVQPAGLIVESTFSSARDMANKLLPVISYVLYLRYRFNSVEQIKQVTSPVLVMHSPDDEIIPFKLGEKVYQAANEPKSFFKMRGDHNAGFILSQPEYQQALRQFLLTLG